MLTLFSKQITKAIDECKSSAVMAKKFVGNIETKKWSLKKKNKIRAYQVTTDDDDEYVSWGSDFDESCSDDGTDGLVSRTNENCDNVNDDYDLNDDDDEEEEEEEEEEDHDNRLTGRCGSYSLTSQTDCHSTSHQLRNLNDGNVGRSENIIHHHHHHHHRGSATYDNTYEAISETPSTSSYGGSSENSSTCFYETPPERRRGSCPSDTDKSSSGIGGMNGSTRSNSGDDRSDLSSLHFDGYCLDEKKRNSHDHDSDLNHHHYRDSHNNHQLNHQHHNNNHLHLHRQLSVEVTTEYIMRELNRKKRTLLNGCEASSETSSGQCSEPSPKPRIRPLVKPAIPPKPNIAQFNQSKPGSPGTRRKIRRKIVRPTGEPPPPPVPKSPPPISPASSKLSLTDRLAELTLDDLNEVLGVQLSSEPEDNGDDGDGAVSKSAAAAAATTTTISYSNDNLNSSSSTTTPPTTNCLDQKDQKKQLQSINNHNSTGSQNQKREQVSNEMGLINTKINKNKSCSSKQSEINDNKSDNNNHDNQSSSLGINEINDIVNGIMDHDDDDFGDYETPLNFKDPIAQQINLLNNLRSILPTSTLTIVSKTPVSATTNIANTVSENSDHHQCTLPLSPTTSSSGSTSGSPSGCNRLISRSSSVASGSFPPDLGFSDCTGISPYPISPPPPFDDNFCCSCRKLMKSVGSTPNLNAIRSSSSPSRSELSLSQVTSTTPLSSSSLSSTASPKNQPHQPLTTFDNNNSPNSSSPHHHHHHHVHHNQQKQQHQHQHQNQHSHLHSHSTSNLSLLTVDRPKLPRSKPDCGNTNSNSNNNNNNNNASTGISLKAEIAAKFAEKAAYAKKIINSRPPFKPFESIYATGKSFGFSSSSSNNHHHPTKSSSSSISASSLNINSNNNNNNNNHHNINRSGSTSNLAQRPLPPLPDDVMPIEKYSWFHGLERDSAATVLEHLGTDGSYLVRPSKRAGQSNPLTLSILHHGKIFHLNIRRRSDGLYCLGKEKDKERTFASVPALIRFHQKEPILLTTKGESAGITKLMVTPISSSSTINPSSSSQLTASS